MIMIARVTPQRYFCCAPYNSVGRCVIQAIINGQELDEQGIRHRYHMRMNVPNAHIPHVFDTIVWYEKSYGRSDQAQITIKYSINGGNEKVWHWQKDGTSLRLNP